MRPLVLIGFMGSGKSTYGRALSGKCGCPFIDTDDTIEERAGKRIADIFADEGEEAFRNMESALIRELAEKQDEEAVISCGGGLPVREENRKLLKKAGVCVYLRAGEEFLLRRLENDRDERPMISAGDLKERIHSLLSAREELYLEAADFVLELEDIPEEKVISSLERIWREINS
ncbi:MAG: shikimate kinase [Lachnospiraceae bacterium]|nr:shikimate kinase [Lachnospiraceae bacterium]